MKEIRMVGKHCRGKARIPGRREEAVRGRRLAGTFGRRQGHCGMTGLRVWPSE